MNSKDFIELVRQPGDFSFEQISDLNEIIKLYPAFVHARILYVKALHQSNSVLFESNLKQATLYSSNRRSLYYLIQPERKLTVEPYRKPQTRRSQGDYFDMIDSLECDGGDKSQSLKNLAERLKSARAMVMNPGIIKELGIKSEIKTVSSSFKTTNMTEDAEISESVAKNFIREKKYVDAIEILRILNLNNPKKSVYFADQIRFLEKVIGNLKN